MQVVEVPINDLKPAEYNPRKMTEKQARDLEESIKRFGIVDPIVVNGHPDRRNVVIGGHQRLKIAANLGFQAIPVVYVDLDEKSEQELNLRLNRNLGEWDWDLLANFEKDLLSDVGFSKEEMEKNFGLDVKEDGFNAEEERDKIIEAETKPGDMYQMGELRLLCGDCTKREDVEKLLRGGVR